VTDRAWLIVTGSRTLADYGLVASALDEAWHDATQDGYTALTLVHGAAKGADSLAERWWEERRRHGVERDEFPARWEDPCVEGACKPGHRRERKNGSTFCPAQGNYRNQRIVDHVAPHLPHALLLAIFAQPHSTGTLDCLRRGIAAGIPYRLIGDPPTLKEITRA
jgi:hypothetical protein